ncbi:hypothetical protein [Modestobacter sp. SYSU DS0875]
MKCMLVVLVPCALVAFAANWPLTLGEALFGLGVFAVVAALAWFAAPAVVPRRGASAGRASANDRRAGAGRRR